MSNRSWMLLSLSAMALLGCTRTAPDIGDANVSALLGAPTFAGKWRCKPERLPGPRGHERSATSCTAEDSSGTTSTLVHTVVDTDGRMEVANRAWWIRDSTEWVARRDSIEHALLKRFPNPALCQGPPAAFAPAPLPAPAGVVRDSRAWRAQGYDVEIAAQGPKANADPSVPRLYMLSLNVTKAPAWILECGTEAQWEKLPRRTAPRRSTDSARR